MPVSDGNVFAGHAMLRLLGWVGGASLVTGLRQAQALSQAYSMRSPAGGRTTAV